MNRSTERYRKRLYRPHRKSRYTLPKLAALMASLAAGLLYLMFSPINDDKLVTPIKEPLLKASVERDAPLKDFLGPIFQKSIEENRNERSDIGLTSVGESSVDLVSPKGRDFEVGDVVTFHITSRSPNGLDRTTGGNFYFATLSSARDPQEASTTGGVVDYGNGTYEVVLLAAWPGRARFNLTLVLTGGAVQLLENSIWPADDRMQWLGHFAEDGRSAVTRCFLRRGWGWVGMCEYPAPHALGGTSMVCHQPPNISCKALVSYTSNWDAATARIAELTKGKEYLFESPYYMEPMHPSTEILTIKGFGSPKVNLLPCKPDQEIPAIQGYWKDGRWNSLLCEFPKCTKTSLEKCLYNREVILLGDSTTRQWLMGLFELLGQPTTEVRNEGNTLMQLKAYFSKLKLGVYFQFHPDRVGSDVFRVDAMRYEVDVLDELNRTDCRYIVAVSPWAHFSWWRRDVYIERAWLLRKAVIRLKKRCPDVPVVVKGPHPREHLGFTERSLNSDYILKEIGRINEKAFRGTGTFFLPSWDMNLSHDAKNTCHMPQTIIKQELLMFFGYACEQVMLLPMNI